MDKKTEEQLRWENESAMMHLQKANARLVKLRAMFFIEKVRALLLSVELSITHVLALHAIR